jgi:hypothetical protein
MKLVDRSKLFAGAALTALIMAGSPLAAYAHNGGDDGGSGSGSGSSNTATTDPDSHTSTSGSGSSSSLSGSGSSGRRLSHDATTSSSGDDSTSEDESQDDKSGSVRERAAKLLEDRRQNHKGRSQEQRQEACENHKDTIDDHFTNLGSKAGRYLNGFNNIFTKVQAYQTKNQLDVANYDALVADASAQQTAATAAVNTLKGLAGTKIDCASEDPASDVASVRTAVQDARTALQNYRVSLKKLVRALHDAKKAANTSNTTEDN